MAIYVDEIARKAGMSKASVRRVMNAQMEVCADRLAEGEGVNMLGVGISPVKNGDSTIYRATVGKRLRQRIGEKK
jgi:nucleoid DNA-binding protein